MSLIRYRTLPMGSLQQQINRMFDDFDRPFGMGGEGIGGGTFAPAMDVKEDADEYIVHLEAPGVKQENLQLTLQDNVLTVRGSKEHASENNDGQFRRVERSYGSFARSVTLPRPVDGAKVSAHLEDGVLEIRLPKVEDAKPRQIAIGTTQQSAALSSGDSAATAPVDPDNPQHEQQGAPEGQPS